MTITPDDKDWTWVLGAPCPECGFDARAVRATDVAARIRATVPAWLAALDSPGCAQRPDPSRWSTLEYACHVRDVHRLYTQRLGLMLEQDDPLFPNWDQDVSAVEERYDLQDPRVVGGALVAAAEAMATAYDAVGDRWGRTVRRSDDKAFTVDTFARYYLHDIEHHTWDISGRAAGSWV